MAKSVKRNAPKVAKSAFPVANWAILILLGAICCALLCQLTDLTLVDLGRHLKNGEVLLHGSAADRQALLHTNFYSYAYRDFPFINHHWLTGVIFYLFWRTFSFEGLTVLYAALAAAAVMIVYWVGQRNSSPVVAAPIAALALPVITWHVDVRPEGFTYLFIAVFCLLLYEWNRGRLEGRWLYAIPLLMIFWVNLHIAFIFGFLILGAFCLKRIVPAIRASGVAQAVRQEAHLLRIAVLTTAATLLNPSLVKGALYPFAIYGSAKFDVIEDQPVFSVPMGEGWRIQFFFFKSLLVLVAAAFAARWIWGPRGKKPIWPELLLLGSIGVLSTFAVRHFAVFALLTIAIVPGLLQDVLVGRRMAQSQLLRFAAAALGAAGLFNCWQQFDGRFSKAGLGLKPNVNATAEFLEANRVAGPILNDFNIGGYLIFHRFPARGATDGDRIFIDGRPEAYPPAFFELLTKMQANDDVWRETDQKYRFNAIVFSLQYNARPETERFLIARAHDPAWAPVFADDYSLIFLRRTEENAAAIRAHELPQNLFR